jgi:[protein-PII] uridylyltransferase
MSKPRQRKIHDALMAVFHPKPVEQKVVNG